MTHYNSDLVSAIVRARHCPHISHLKNIQKNFVSNFFNGESGSLKQNVFLFIFLPLIFPPPPPHIYLLMPFSFGPTSFPRFTNSQPAFVFQEQTVSNYLRAAPAALQPAHHPAACSQDWTEEPAQETKHNQHKKLRPHAYQNCSKNH
jgi:hypothetical protein